MPIFVSLTQRRVFWEEDEKMSLSDSSIGKFVGIFLINDTHGKIQPIMDGANPIQVVLGYISRLHKIWKASQ